MKKLSIKDIVNFKNKSDRSKKTFVSNLKFDKKDIKTDSGGDYWVTSLSAISNSFKANDLKFIVNKIQELEEKLSKSEIRTTKGMYKRNIDILYSFEDFDFKKLIPLSKITFLKKAKEDSILNIKGLEVQATPHHVFTFKKGDEVEVGAIWFIAKLEGFKEDELGMFTDILYRYLKKHHSKHRTINTKYCIAFDLFKNRYVSFKELQNGKVETILNTLLDEIKKLV